MRDILRRYTGWYDGNPTMLFPSTRAAVSSEVLALIGDSSAVLARADELAAGGEVEELQLALHLLDLLVFGSGPDAQEARRRKADVLELRGKAERSFVARNVLRSAATIEREQVG